MSAFKPFVEGAVAVEFGGLSVESSDGAVTVHGYTELRKDKASLRRARELASLLSSIADGLSSMDDLPERAGPPSPAAVPERVGNPFL